MGVVPMYTASGEAHGLIDVKTNSCEDNDFKHFSPAHKEQLKKEKKEDSRLVEVEYMNSRGKHERLTKPYCRYAGDPIQIWHLIPGKTYKLPMGFVKEINGNTMPRRSGLLEVDGNKVTADGSPLAKDEEGVWLHKLIPVAFN